MSQAVVAVKKRPLAVFGRLTGGFALAELSDSGPALTLFGKCA